MADEREIFDQAAPKPEEQDSAIGLVQNAEGVPFQCGTCNHFKGAVCNNPLPKLNGQQVAPEWCCNHYEHDGMKTIIE